ncbi:glutamyl-tRNA reductase [Ilumatobacter sp.]|uniref:glutamyl-tRNA reductase n=1 Tax=Ilumatobacter sp. TaxID=1967498 RepID=UPI003AF609E0
MSILVIGVNHRSGPLSVLERVTIAPTDVPKAVDGLVRLDNVREVVVLSTCNRTEIYAVAERFHGAYADILDFLCDLGDIAPDELHPHLYSEHDDGAVAHLFEVAAGLDSAVIGESEILGQLRQAWQVAQREGGARSTLNLLFRHAVGVGKRARTETGIARGTASVSHAAVEMAVDHHGSMAGRRVALVGAGSMGEGIAVALHGAGVDDVMVVNRSPERGQALADRVNGRALGMDRLREALEASDVVLTSTGAGEPVVTADVVRELDRAGRPLLFVDIAVPRDVAPEIADLPHVSVLDLEDLITWAERGRSERFAEVDRVAVIVAEEVERFGLEAAALQAAPLVSSLRRRAEELRAAELSRHATRIGQLDDDQREMIDAITRGLVAKLLHEPSVRLRTQAGTPQGERNAAAVADLFDLG